MKLIQTSVQDSRTIRFGSAKFEVGADLGSLVNLGAMRDIKFEENFDRVKLMSDNAGEINAGIRNHAAAIEGNLMEIDLTKLNTIRGGLDNYSAVAAAPISVLDEVVVLTLTNNKRLINKNGAGTVVTGIVITNSAASVTYVLNTDYTVSVDADGYTVIARIAAGAITSAQSLKVDYTYTPNTAKILASGGKITLSDRVVRITNSNDLGKIFRITIYKSQTSNGITIELPADEDEDPAMTLIRMEGKLDVSRTAGDQLFEIYDEQGA